MLNKKQIIAKGSFGFALIIAGIILNSLGVNKEYLGFPSIGNWLLFVGFISLSITIITTFTRKDKIVDERMEKIGHQAAKITFLFVILGAFIIMIIDGIKTITMSYSLFMSDMIMLMTLIYFVSYKVIERKM